MKHSQKAKTIILICMLAIGICSAASLLKAFRPSGNLPYERVTMEQAVEYMTFEEKYILLDIGSEEAYRKKHIAGARNIPYEALLATAPGELPDKTAVIYVYDRRERQADKACRKLTEMGYTGITCIGNMDDWPGDFEGTQV